MEQKNLAVLYLRDAFLKLNIWTRNFEHLERKRYLGYGKFIMKMKSFIKDLFTRNNLLLQAMPLG